MVQFEGQLGSFSFVALGTCCAVYPGGLDNILGGTLDIHFSRPLQRRLCQLFWQLEEFDGFAGNHTMLSASQVQVKKRCGKTADSDERNCVGTSRYYTDSVGIGVCFDVLQILATSLQ